MMEWLKLIYEPSSYIFGVSILGMLGLIYWQLRQYNIHNELVIEYSRLTERYKKTAEGRKSQIKKLLDLKARMLKHGGVEESLIKRIDAFVLALSKD